MRTSLCCWCAVLILCGAPMVSVMAQVPSPAPTKSNASKRWTVSIGAQNGAYYAPNSGWQDAVVEFSYEFQQARSHAFLQSAAFLESAGMGNISLPGVGNYDVYRRRSAYGLWVSSRAAMHDRGGRNALYVGAGGGVYRSEVSREFRSKYDTDDDTDDGQPITESFSERVGARLGWKVFTGLQVKQAFLELGWRDLGKLDNVPYRSASLSLGYRF